ncbi:polysaccharide biosynthesis protein [Rhodobacterales bacterium LSUCC1028]|nr:polysaccharide biosynthesis protein [Rhodobacterales bacterium LSUCC1028]
METQLFCKSDKLLVTGGTGSFGNAIVKRFIDTDIGEIRIFSRDEKKQDAMRKRYRSSKLKFFVGDVRDPQAIDPIMRGVNYVFHAAALKQVPSCEFYPMEAVKTNIIGTDNILTAAINHKVDRVVCLSTDKAVYPINAMGISKALMEKVVVAKSRNSAVTTICATRYGNVMASRGSVIPLFISQIRENREITITDSNMTRFMMSLDDAVDLVLHAFKNGRNGDIFVQKAPAATVGLLAETIKEMLSVPDHPVRVIGTRHGEKLYEVLLSREEMFVSEDQGMYYRIPADLRGLDYDVYFEKGEKLVSEASEYHSHNTHQLDKEELEKILKKLPDFSV